MINISPKEGYEKLNEFIIIDVRTPSEYENGHIKDALNIDVTQPSFVDKIIKLDKNKKYLLYCQSGNRSFLASNLMQNLGFNEVFNLEGGISKWINDGFENLIVT